MKALNFFKIEQFKENRLIWDGPLPTPEGISSEGEALAEMESLTTQEEVQAVLSDRIADWEKKQGDDKLTDLFRQKMGEFIGQAKDLESQLKTTAEISPEQLETFKIDLVNLIEQSVAEAKFEDEKRKPKLNQIKAKRDGFQLNKDSQKTAFITGLLAGIKDPYLTILKKQLEEKFATIERPLLDKIKRFEEKANIAEKENSLPQDSEIAAIPGDMTTYLDVKNPTGTITQFPEVAKTIIDQQEYVGNARYFIEKTEREKLLHGKTPGPECKAALDKWENKFQQEYLSQNKLPSHGEINNLINQADNEIIIGYLVDKINEKTPNKITSKEFDIFIQNYEKGSTGTLDESTREKIKALFVQIQPKLTALGINIQIEGSADSGTFNLTREIGKYQNYAEAAKKMKTSPLWNSPEVARLHGEIGNLISANEAGPQQLRKFLEENEEMFSSPNGPLNVILAYKRMTESFGDNVVANATLGIRINSTSEGKEYRYSQLRFSSRHEVSSGMAPVVEALASKEGSAADAGTTPAPDPDAEGDSEEELAQSGEREDDSESDSDEEPDAGTTPAPAPDEEPDTGTTPAADPTPVPDSGSVPPPPVPSPSAAPSTIPDAFPNIVPAIPGSRRGYPTQDGLAVVPVDEDNFPVGDLATMPLPASRLPKVSPSGFARLAEEDPNQEFADELTSKERLEALKEYGKLIEAQALKVERANLIASIIQKGYDKIGSGKAAIEFKRQYLSGSNIFTPPEVTPLMSAQQVNMGEALKLLEKLPELIEANPDKTIEELLDPKIKQALIDCNQISTSAELADTKVQGFLKFIETGELSEKQKARVGKLKIIQYVLATELANIDNSRTKAEWLEQAFEYEETTQDRRQKIVEAMDTLENMPEIIMMNPEVSLQDLLNNSNIGGKIKTGLAKCSYDFYEQTKVSGSEYSSDSWTDPGIISVGGNLVDKDPETMEELQAQYNILITVLRRNKDYNAAQRIMEDDVLGKYFAEKVKEITEEKQLEINTEASNEASKLVQKYRAQWSKEIHEKFDKGELVLEDPSSGIQGEREYITNFAAGQEEAMREEIYDHKLKSEAGKILYASQSFKGTNAQLWDQYNDMLNPAGEFFNLKDTTWDTIIEEVAINAPLIILSGGIASVARAGISLGARAILSSARFASIGLKAARVGMVVQGGVRGGRILYGAGRAARGLEFAGKAIGLVAEGTAFEIVHEGLQGRWLFNKDNDYLKKIFWACATLGTFHWVKGKAAGLNSSLDQAIVKIAVKEPTLAKNLRHLVVTGSSEVATMMTLGYIQHHMEGGTWKDYDVSDNFFRALLSVGALNIAGRGSTLVISAGGKTLTSFARVGKEQRASKQIEAKVEEYTQLEESLGTEMQRLNTENIIFEKLPKRLRTAKAKEEKRVRDARIQEIQQELVRVKAERAPFDQQATALRAKQASREQTREAKAARETAKLEIFIERQQGYFSEAITLEAPVLRVIGPAQRLFRRLKDSEAAKDSISDKKIEQARVIVSKMEAAIKTMPESPAKALIVSRIENNKRVLRSREILSQVNVKAAVKAMESNDVEKLTAIESQYKEAEVELQGLADHATEGSKLEVQKVQEIITSRKQAISEKIAAVKSEASKGEGKKVVEDKQEGRVETQDWLAHRLLVSGQLKSLQVGDVIVSKSGNRRLVLEKTDKKLVILKTEVGGREEIEYSSPDGHRLDPSMLEGVTKATSETITSAGEAVARHAEKIATEEGFYNEQERIRVEAKEARAQEAQQWELKKAEEIEKAQRLTTLKEGEVVVSKSGDKRLVLKVTPTEIAVLKINKEGGKEGIEVFERDKGGFELAAVDKVETASTETIAQAKSARTEFKEEMDLVGVEFLTPEQLTVFQRQQQKILQERSTLSEQEFQASFKDKKASLRQGNVGDCYLVAGLNSLRRSPFFETIVRLSVKPTTQGGQSGWEVKIPLGDVNGETVFVAKSELGSHPNPNVGKPDRHGKIDDRKVLTSMSGPEGLQILEAAFVKSKTGILNRALVEGGFGHQALQHLIGAKSFEKERVSASDQSPEHLRENRTSLGYGLSSPFKTGSEFARQKAREFLDKFDNTNDIATVNTPPHEKGHNAAFKIGGQEFYFSHAYSLIAVNKGAGTVTVVNPHNTNVKIELTYDQFMETFAQVSSVRVNFRKLMQQFKEHDRKAA